MPTKQFKSIAEIDEELEKLYKETQEKSNETETESEDTDETVEAEPVEEEAVETAEDNDTVEAEPEQPAQKKPEPDKPAAVESKPTKDDKRDYAFKQLREEAEVAKKELTNKNQVVSQFEQIAKAQGFDSVDSFLKAWKDKQTEAEAQRRGMDPKVLKELEETKERLTRIEQEKNEVVKKTQITRVNNTISKFAQTHKLSDAEMNNIIQTMGADNVTVDMLVAAPTETLEKMLTGYAQDILIEKKVQAKLAALEKSGTAPVPEEKHKNTVTSKKPDPFSKEALADEMEQFKKQNYPWLK